MRVLEIIEKVANTAGTNDKLAILKEHKDNELLKQVFYYAFNPHLRYYMQEKSIPACSEFVGGNFTAETLHTFLDCFSKRRVTGNDAIELLKQHFNSLSKENAEVLKRIILKDLKCNVSGKGANKVWKGLIPEFPYMRCSGPNKEKNIVYPAIVQTKADGAFCNVIVHNGKVEFLTRNGTSFTLPSLADAFLELNTNDIVFTGELTVSDGSGGVLDRKTGNGMINKIIKREQTKESYEKKMESASEKQKITLTKKFEALTKELAQIEENIIIDLWDCIPVNRWEEGNYSLVYEARIKQLHTLISENETKKICLIETKWVQNKKEAQDFYDRMISGGKEGAVLKNLDMPWKDGTSTEQIKMKQVLDCDLEIVGWYKGKQESEFRDGIGGFNLRSSCGQLEVNAGSGLTREQRGLEPKDPNDSSAGLKAIDGFDFEQYTGKIVAIEFNEVVDSKGKETWSLFLPIIIEVREDKTEADSLEKIKQAKENNIHQEQSTL